MPGELVDSHVHLLPDRLAAAIRAFFAGHGVPADRFAHPLDHGAVCDRLGSAGVGEAWTLPYVRRPGAAADLNAATAEIAARLTTRGPVRVVAGATVHPADTDPAGLVRRAVDGGARVLKLHCSVGDHRPDDPRLDPVWSYASEARLPVVVHAGHGVGGQTDADELEPVAEVARRWPEARLVIAHCGHRAAARAIELLGEHPSLHADTTPVISELVDLPPAAAAVADRLLLGTDAPNTGFHVEEVVAGLGPLGLAPGALAGVLGGNARRLLAEVRG